MAGIYYYVFSTLAWGFSIGIQIIVARRLGEGKLNRIGVVFEHGLCFVFLLSMTLFLIQRYYSDVLLGASIQSPNIYAAAMEYMSYRHYGIIFVCFNFLFRALYIGLSNTKIIGYSTAAMAIINVIFNYLLIFGKFGFPELGVGGAALASVMAEISACLIFIFYTLLKLPIKQYALFFVPQTRGLVNAHRTENGLSNHGTKTVVIRDMVYIFHAHRTHGRTPHSDNHHRT